MDEPYSALDVFTAESLRSEVYRLWTGDSEKAAHLPAVLKSILLITHIIEEAAFLGDRIVIMGTKPGHVRDVVENRPPHPREYLDTRFLSMVQQLHDIIVSEHLPGAPTVEPPTGAGVAPCEPLPTVTVGEVLGLLKILHDHGGCMDVFHLDNLTDYDFGHTLAVVKAAEMFDLIETPGNTVVLTEIGRRLLSADMNARMQLIRRQLFRLGTFQLIARIVREAKDGRLPAEVVREELAVRLPMQDVEAAFKTAVGWGLFVELFDYDADAAVLRFVGQAP